jgi:hypothetical protein
MKSKIRVSSLSGGSGSRIAEAYGGLSIDSGLAIWDSSSSDFSTSAGVFSKIFVRMLLPILVETCKNEPLKAVLRRFKVFLSSPI